MNLDQRILNAKKNPYEMNNLINDYKPFIISVVQKQTGKFVQYGRDDELSVGLMAFEEAIRAHNSEKGAFLSFAETVIKRRLIDYVRKESRHTNVIPLSTFYNEEDDKDIDVTAEKSVEVYADQEISAMRKYEILEIQKELKEFGISFFELPEISPKHIETKELYRTIISTIINKKEYLETVKTKKYIPIAQIEEITGIHRKTIERSRKYCIAMIVILTGDYKYIQDFIDWR